MLDLCPSFAQKQQKGIRRIFWTKYSKFLSEHQNINFGTCCIFQQNLKSDFPIHPLTSATNSHTFCFELKNWFYIEKNTFHK